MLFRSLISGRQSLHHACLDCQSDVKRNRHIFSVTVSTVKTHLCKPVTLCRGKHCLCMLPTRTQEHPDDSGHFILTGFHRGRSVHQICLIGLQRVEGLTAIIPVCSSLDRSKVGISCCVIEITSIACVVKNESRPLRHI